MSQDQSKQPGMQPSQKPVSYRSTLTPVEGSGKEHFADVLSTVDPKHLHARARIPSIFNMAVHSTLGAYVRKEKTYQNLQGVSFHMGTVAGLMGCFHFEYEAESISLDGKGRGEVVDVLKLAAIGSQDETGAIASSVLNEGSKNLTGKSSKTS